jgi:hypothetical protein
MGPPPKKGRGEPLAAHAAGDVAFQSAAFNAVGGFNYQSDKKVPLHAGATEGATLQNNRTMRQNCRGRWPLTLTGAPADFPASSRQTSPC